MAAAVEADAALLPAEAGLPALQVCCVAWDVQDARPGLYAYDDGRMSAVRFMTIDQDHEDCRSSDYGGSPAVILLS
jgi:hypothetical protein